MSKIVTLRDGKDVRDWKCAFANSVLALCSDVNPDLADEAADEELCEGLDPAIAAVHWVVRQGFVPTLGTPVTSLDVDAA